MTNAMSTGDWSEITAGLASVLRQGMQEGLITPGDLPVADPEQTARMVTGLFLTLENNQQAAAGPRGTVPAEPAKIAAELAVAEAQLAIMERDRSPGVGLIAAAMHLRCAMLLFDLAVARSRPPDVLARLRAHIDQVPDDLARRLPIFASAKAIFRLYADGTGFLDDGAALAGDEIRDIWDLAGGDIGRAQAAAARAFATRDRADILAAIEEARMVWIGLPSGSSLRGRVLNLLADTHLTLAGVTRDPGALADALALTIAALRATTTPLMAQAAAFIMADCLSQLAVLGQCEGPLAEAGEELRNALARAGAGPAERAALLSAAGAVAGLRAAALDDELLRRASRQLIEDAEGALPAAPPSARLDELAWTLHDRTARALHNWTMTQALVLGDAEMLPVALRVVGKLECCLAESALPAGPLAERRKDVTQARKRLTAAQRRSARGQPVASWAARLSARSATTLWGAQLDSQLTAQEAAELARQAIEQANALAAQERRPHPDEAIPIFADLDQALAPSLDDTRIRHEAHVLLGLGLAELYAADPRARTGDVLNNAITHLNQGLATGDYPLPTRWRAFLLDALARCYRAAGLRDDDAGTHHQADRAVRAALRELRGCVMIAETAGQALEIASQANMIAARAVGWCMADGRERAAISIAESGRGLVLASVTLAGQAREILCGAGAHAAADAWGTGTEAARAAALDVLNEVSGGNSLLAAPNDAVVSSGMLTARLDAVAYLVPPDEAGDASSDGYAVLVRPLPAGVEVVPLPRLAILAGMPLEEYLAALAAAITAFDLRAEQIQLGAAATSGFRGQSEGEAWASALDNLGWWAYDTVLGPLIAHIRGWRLGHLPRLALIPLGVLGAIPFAAAWTEAARTEAARTEAARTEAEDGTGTQARRYAIEDLVLSYAASAGLLAEVAKRPRQRLGQRVVFVADPTGQFHFSRRIMPGLASSLYPGAAVYGLNRAPDGPATTAVVLGALPGSDREGASLLHLTTHGTMDPEPAVQTRDGTLPLARILDQARGRAVDAPGGLVITNACLTDVTLADYDESLTLATAFLAAGATAVIGTRWPVDDDATTALSVRLHHHLNGGCAPAEALRRAQLDLLRPGPELRNGLGPQFAAISDARLRHPASWAGHVHHGI
jgi:hypothetical protein